MSRRSIISFMAAGLKTPILKALSASLLISVVVRLIGLAKEATIAGLFGTSVMVDVYLLTLIIVTFFVGPAAGSLATPLTKKLQELGVSGDVNAARNLLIKCFGTIITLMAVLTLVTGLYFDPISRLWSEAPTGVPMLVPFQTWLLPIGLLSAISMIAYAALSAEKRFSLQIGIPVIVPLTIILSCLIAPPDQLVMALFVGTSAGFTLEALLALIAVRRKILNAALRACHTSRSAFRGVIRQWPALAASGLIMNGCVVVDQLMATLAGDGAVSIVNFGSRISLGILSLASVLWVVLFPFFVDHVVKKEFARVRQNFVITVTIVLGAGMAGCLALVQASEWIIELVFQRGAFNSSDTQIVSDVQTYYFLHIPFFVITLISSRILNAFDKSTFFLLCNIMTLALNIGFNLLFIEMFGVVGVAMATLASYAIMSMIWVLTALFLISHANAAQNR